MTEIKDTKDIKTALISVFNKDGIDEILRLLYDNGVKFLSTGGTRSSLNRSATLVMRWRI